MRCRGILTLGFIALIFNLTAAAGSAQTVLWDESVNGDLSNNQAAPNAFTVPPATSAHSFSTRQFGTAPNHEFIFTVAPVPEPGSLLLSGLAGLVAVSRWLRRLGKA